MRATLRHYRAIHAAVAAGAAVASAVLAGALLVGDSVRESLREMSLDRLGRVEWALASHAPVDRRLARDLDAVSILSVPGSAVAPDRGLRVSGLTVHGVDADFFSLFPDVPEAVPGGAGGIFPPVLLNHKTATELGAGPGDPLVLHLGRFADIPRETLMGETDPADVLQSIRVEVAAVLPDRGAGRFGLIPTQQTPALAYLDRSRLQRALKSGDRVNRILLPLGREAPHDELTRALRAADFGFVVEPAEGSVRVSPRELVIDPDSDRVLGEVLDGLGMPYQRSQAYLANRLAVGRRAVPYSMVLAVDPRPAPAWAALARRDEQGAVPAIEDDGIVLNAWTADELAAAAGDSLELTYYEVARDERLHERTKTFRVQAIVAMQGLAADRGVVPDYPGIREARDMAEWDPPFPVDLDRIRPADEEYWDDWGATPKAFVSAATGRELWATRYGATTAVRVVLPPESDASAVAAEIAEGLARRLDPSRFGLEFRGVRQRGVEASAGATDFAQLFLAFSAFLIIAAALLVGLLFRLGVDRRVREIGLELAVGFPVARVRRGLLAEGLVLALTGGTLGLIAGVAYAAAMIAGLETLWRPAIGSAELALHVAPGSLLVGLAVALVVVMAAVWFSVRRVAAIPAPRLLAGDWREERVTGRGGRARVLAAVAGAGALGLTAWAWSAGLASSPAVAFGIGGLSLVAGLAAFAAWCGRARGAVRGTLSLAARNTAWVPGRSLLCVCLVAQATFAIAMVAANRAEVHEDLTARESGTGGFPLVADCDVSLHQDLNREADRFDLGFSETDSARLAGADVYALRLLRGDDASCLNLYRPDRPRVLGVPPRFVARGGFGFSEHLPLDPGASSPWSLLERTFPDGAIATIGDANSVRWILNPENCRNGGSCLGKTFETSDGIRYRFVALLAGSLFQSELLIGERAFLETFPETTGAGFFLVDVDPASAGAVAETLESGLSAFGFDVSDAAARIAEFRRVENTYMATFQLLGGLGLLLGTFGLAVVLLRNMLERRGELAAMRAFGFSRPRIGRLVFVENAFLLAAGLGIGAVAALLGALPRLGGAGFPWGSLGATLAAVLVSGLLASAWALRAALRVPLLGTLKKEQR